MQKPSADNNRQATTSSATDTSWRDYYASLSDEQKWKVWYAYYEQLHSKTSYAPKSGQTATGPQRQPKTIGSVVVSQVAAIDKKFFTVKNQLRSIAVGLVCGGIVVLASTFTLFNEMIIAPFIRPGQPVQAAAVDVATGVPVDPTPKVRIPKISVDIPVVYGLATTNEKQFELALDEGVVHYPTTVLPGQPGNAAFFGHSSNNIFNPGKYKFAFVLLNELVIGDSFQLTHDGKLYTYQVIDRRIVKPTEVSVLGSVEGQVSTATLITCDPPGTSNNRLVVIGKQVNPNPAGDNMLATPTSELPEPASIQNLPGNGPGLLNRLWRSIFGES